MWLCFCLFGFFTNFNVLAYSQRKMSEIPVLRGDMIGRHGLDALLQPISLGDNKKDRGRE